jgi:hypothetical protein
MELQPTGGRYPPRRGSFRRGKGSITRFTIRHPVEFPYTSQEIDTLFRLANEEGVEKGGRYDARSAAISIWSHHWQERATWEESDAIGTFYFYWEPTPMLYEIQADGDFDLEALMQELGRLELKAFGWVKHGEVP